jgi:hypothetical protein
MEQTRIDTPLAVVERTAPQQITIDLKPGQVVNVAGLRAIREARKQLAGTSAAHVLALVPEDLDFEPGIILTDHYADEDPAPYTQAMAIVTSGTLFAQLVRIYCTYHRTNYPVQVFACPDKARQWLAGLAAA